MVTTLKYLACSQAPSPLTVQNTIQQPIPPFWQKGQWVGGVQTMLSYLFVWQKFVTNVIVHSRIAYKLNKKFIESRSNKNQFIIRSSRPVCFRKKGVCKNLLKFITFIKIHKIHKIYFTTTIHSYSADDNKLSAWARTLSDMIKLFESESNIAANWLPNNKMIFRIMTSSNNYSG